MNRSIAPAYFVLIAALSWAPSAQAVEADIQFECLSIDGIPISSDTAQAISCCANGQLIANPPATCRAGFNSIAASAAIGAAMSVNLALKTLETAHDLNGAAILYDSPTQPTQATQSTQAQPAPPSDQASQLTTSAITARSFDSIEASSDSQSRMAGANDSGGGASQALPQNAVSLVFGQSQPDSKGLTGDRGQSSFLKIENGVASELKFGEVAANRSDVKIDSPVAFQFPTGSSKDSSETDSADYFSRIDKSTSLFEAVSQRYLKVSAQAGRK